MTDPILSTIANFPPEVAQAALYEAIASRYRDSLYLTAKDLCGLKDLTWLTHGSTIDALEAATLRKLIVLPRGTFKSSLVDVAYPIWLLLRNPNLRILIDSEKYENSKNFIREIKGKLEDARMTRVFGAFPGAQWGEGEITIRQRTKVFKEASITASGIGAGKTGQHYDVILHDDMNTHENSATVENRKKIIDHVKMNTSILEPNGIMAFTATRYAEDDIPGWLLSELIPEHEKPEIFRRKSA